MKPIVVHASELAFEPLGIEGAAVAELAQAVGPDRSTTIGSGIARFERCRFEWTLSYDETVFVVEGRLRLWVDGEARDAVAGDVVFLPDGSTIEYDVDEPCLLFYATYPVDWASTREADEGDPRGPTDV